MGAVVCPSAHARSEAMQAARSAKSRVGAGTATLVLALAMLALVVLSAGCASNEEFSADGRDTRGNPDVVAVRASDVTRVGANGTTATTGSDRTDATSVLAFP